MSGKTKALTSQCKLHMFDHKIATMAYVTITRSELFTPRSCLQCVFFKDCFISLGYLNKFDATSKVMYRHEIICTGNTAQFN